MKRDIIHLIISYLNSHNSYLDDKVRFITGEQYTCITCTYHGMDVEICVYNDTFIKIKVDNLPLAICDGIKSFRKEFDRLYVLRHQW